MGVEVGVGVFVGVGEGGGGGLLMVVGNVFCEFGWEVRSVGKMVN